ncbi:MAG: c-type cytochrome [Deltaproteobacteria bacterium]|nr:MAG: c-type cytochrome [Deltaproteobacteria bacterium]
MLSKSQARLFFFTATFGFSGVFLALTVDTLRQVPERSNQDRMSAAVVHGKEIWEANNCMGCHTLLGEGAYYAPELTRVVERRGEEWIKVFIKDPEAMFPGRRKMVTYDFTDEEIDDVIAFLAWVGEIDTNGFPAEPDLKPVTPATVASAASASAATQAPTKFTAVCTACHSLGGSGGTIGPALDGVGHRYDEASLRTWLADPGAVKPGTAMPNLGLDDDELDALTQFLIAQK